VRHDDIDKEWRVLYETPLAPGEKRPDYYYNKIEFKRVEVNDVQAGGVKKIVTIVRDIDSSATSSYQYQEYYALEYNLSHDILKDIEAARVLGNDLYTFDNYGDISYNIIDKTFHVSGSDGGIFYTKDKAALKAAMKSEGDELWENFNIPNKIYPNSHWEFDAEYTPGEPEWIIVGKINDLDS
jgi:hypothetical protein